MGLVKFFLRLLAIPAALYLLISGYLTRGGPIQLGPPAAAPVTTAPTLPVPEWSEKKFTQLEPKFVAVLNALQKNPPHGRSWEELPQDEFIDEVNEWGE